MPTRNALRLFAILASLATAAACSSSSSGPASPASSADASAEAEPVATIDDDGGTNPTDASATCTLPVHTGRATCDDCLLKSCCTVVNACFGDPLCEQINTCMNNCGTKFGRTDAGADCVRQCATGKDKEAAAAKLVDMLDCENNRCGSFCK